jgi:hypothetical protein
VAIVVVLSFSRLCFFCVLQPISHVHHDVSDQSVERILQVSVDSAGSNSSPHSCFRFFLDSEIGPDLT